MIFHEAWALSNGGIGHWAVAAMWGPKVILYLAFTQILGMIASWHPHLLAKSSRQLLEDSSTENIK